MNLSLEIFVEFQIQITKAMQLRWRMKVKVFGASLIDFSPEVSATIKATATTDTSHLPRELKHSQTKRNRERNQRHRHITHPVGDHTFPDKIKCA